MIGEDELRIRLHESLDRAPGGSPALEPVSRRARSLRARRVAAALGAAAVLAAGVAVPLAVLSAEHGNAPHRTIPAASPGTIDRFGIKVDVPNGWYGDAFQEYETSYVQVSTFPIPRDVPYLSAACCHDNAADLRGRMGPSDVAVLLGDMTVGLSNHSGFHPADLPIHLGPDDVGDNFEGLPIGHSLVRQAIEVNGRAVDLWVEFGSDPAPADRLDQVNQMFATLRIEPDSGWTVHDDADDATTIQAPAGWTFREDPAPRLAEPRTLFAVGTWPFREGGDCGPDAALQDLPDDGAFFWVTEYRDPQNFDDFPPRPLAFSYPDETVQPECATERPQYLIRFDGGWRYFQVQIAFGDHASDAMRRDVLDSVNSLSLGVLPQGETLSRWAGLCDRLPWTRCPLADYVRDAIWNAGFGVDGASDSAILGNVHGLSFSMWTTRRAVLDAAISSGMVSRQSNDDGTTVYGDASHAAWNFGPIAVWIERGAGETALPDPDAVAALVRSSQMLQG